LIVVVVVVVVATLSLFCYFIFVGLIRDQKQKMIKQGIKFCCYNNSFNSARLSSLKLQIMFTKD